MSGAIIHTLFIKYPVKDIENKEITTALLKFISANIKIIERMGIKIQIEKITTSDLAAIKKLQKIGITRLPALKTDMKIYIGYQNIISLYKENIDAFTTPQQVAQNKYSGNGGNSDYVGDDMESHLQREIMRDEESDEEDPVPNNTQFSASIRQMEDRRRNFGLKNPQPTVEPQPRQQSQQPRQQSQQQPTKNNKPPVAVNNEADDIQKLVDRLAADVDEEYNEQDKKMERAFWANADLT